MDDLKTFEHGSEETHYVCPERLEVEGNLATCCACVGHKCRDESDECHDKDCPMYVMGAYHMKGSPLCKYG